MEIEGEFLVIEDGVFAELDEHQTAVGFVAEPEITGRPAVLYTAEAGIVTPEFRWPTTPATLASIDSCCVTLSFIVHAAVGL